MTAPDNVAFLLNVDNTLLDNDRIGIGLDHHPGQEFEEESGNRYWEFSEARRHDLGFADYLGALQRCRVQTMKDPGLLLMSSRLKETP